MARLNPFAPEFTPAAAKHACDTQSAPVYDLTEAGLSEQELEELEAADAWVETMVYLDELERDHMIALAQQHAPALAQELEDRILASAGPTAQCAVRRVSKGSRVSRK